MKRVVINLILILLITSYALSQKLQISGIYPNLVMYNEEGMENNFGEAGIGALVPWGDKLWGITYTCHSLHGSTDKLYEIDEKLNKTIRPESVGGTHANRMIHEESEQLIMGPYFIKKDGTVRVAKFPENAFGRLTAVTRHLQKPEKMVYFYDMEGLWYEVNVHTLEVTKLHDKPAPGWHGKGAYTGQGRFIIANNGNKPAPSPYWWYMTDETIETIEEGYEVNYDTDNPENTGVLAEFDGKNWKIIESRQFTDVCGPGGLYGNTSKADPVWAIGWDKRSLRLKVLEKGEWYTYLLPKASHCFENPGGVYTEWPRFRKISPDKWMLDMFGTFFNWPVNFSSHNTKGLSPISSHLRYIPDFGYWNGKVFLGADDAAKVKNEIPPGLNQSNTWFGTVEDLNYFGPAKAWGGPWIKDNVKAGQWSDPFLVNGYNEKILHIQHANNQGISVEIQFDKGNGKWKTYKTVTIDEKGYAFHIFPENTDMAWIRLKSNEEATITATFHLSNARKTKPEEAEIFQSLAEVNDSNQVVSTGFVWPDRELGLQYRHHTVKGNTIGNLIGLYMVSQVQYENSRNDLVYYPSDGENISEIKSKLNINNQGFEVDDASVIFHHNGHTVRLPKNTDYEKAFPEGYHRSLREVQSERKLANIHGTFYEVPAKGAKNWMALRPVCSHNKRVKDFCSWRGLLVMSGTKQDAVNDGNYFGDGQGHGLWFGAVDDLWKLGKPVGVGGPWKNTEVKSGAASDPYLMTGYDKKTLRLSHDSKDDVVMHVEVNFTNLEQWATYKEITVPAGETVTHHFPEGFQAHWARLISSSDCMATAIFLYE